MKIKPVLRNTLIITAIFLNIGCDQVTKNIARNQIEYHEIIPVIDNFLTLTKVENSGAFLSLGSNLPDFIKVLVLNVLPIMVMLWGLYLVVEKTNMSRLLVVGLCFVIGGGTGNLYDRMRYGSVTDFLHLNFGIFETGIFNMADVSIMVGMGLIFIDIYLKKLIIAF
ncbi:signal peptidase II [Daejeonella lutea]|uniref:Lipoprotein signal peptidase n=1 Tax=Daejeonella lutea TaxID=572036 RepID=A0A1T5ETX6_9SPHI|nr:signal peptidase II [Daejeonella lutea]SKB87397.1 signal peptidase II [Daejeonella lutea]